jgi:hypothetical protein
MDVANMTMLSLVTTLAILPLASESGDGDAGDWWLQSLAYMALRTEFEFRSLYNPIEFLTLLKNPSAAINLLEQFSVFFKIFFPEFWMENGALDKISRGPYEGMPRIMRNIIKMTPAKNIIEATQPKLKREYLQTQMVWQ